MFRDDPVSIHFCIIVVIDVLIVVFIVFIIVLIILLFLISLLSEKHPNHIQLIWVSIYRSLVNILNL